MVFSDPNLTGYLEENIIKSLKKKLENYWKQMNKVLWEPRRNSLLYCRPWGLFMEHAA